MDIHEHQAKEILKKFGIPVPNGIVIFDTKEILNKISKLKSASFVVKAQIHAGGRGKAGGIKVAKNIEELTNYSKDMLGMRLITPQTSKEGKIVHKIFIGEDVYYSGENQIEEKYVSVLLNRATNMNMIMYSTEGGMDIEKVAEYTPDKIFTEQINPISGLTKNQYEKIATNLNMQGEAFDKMCDFVKKLSRVFSFNKK